MALAPSVIVNLPGYPFSNLPSVATIAALRALASSGYADGANIAVDGGSASGDGSGGLYVWNDASTATDDGVTIIKPTDTPSLSAGRWILSGTALNSFTQGGTGALTSSNQAKLRERVSATDYSTGLQGAVNYLSGGGVAHINPGSLVLSDTVTITTNRTSVEGAGAQASVISFAPNATKAAIKYDGASSLFQFRVGGLGFKGEADTSTKTAIEINDGRTFEIYDIGISEGAWLGSGSIGIHTKGRDSGHIRDLNLACARPFVASNNPDFPSIDADGFVFERWNVYTTLTTGKVMEFEDGFNFSNTVFRDLFLQKGKYAVYWNDTTSTVGSYGVVFDNFRDEQSDDATGYSIYLASSAQALQSVTFRNCYFTSGRNSVYLRGARSVVFENCIFASTGTLLDITFETDTVVTLINCRSLSGASVTMTNGKRIQSRRPASTEPITTFDVWVHDGATRTGSIYQDAPLGGTPFTVANNADEAICDDTFTGIIMVTTDEDSSAMYALRGPTHTVGEINDIDTVFTGTKDSASSTNLFWDAGSSRYRIQNKRGATRTYTVTKFGASI